MGWMTEGRFPREAENVSLYHCVQTGYETHPESCPENTGGRAAGAWSWPLNSI